MVILDKKFKESNITLTTVDELISNIKDNINSDQRFLNLKFKLNLRGSNIFLLIHGQQKRLLFEFDNQIIHGVSIDGMFNQQAPNYDEIKYAISVVDFKLHKKVMQGKQCPYCGRKTKFIDASDEHVYHNYTDHVYICRPCDAYVGVHKGTERAFGYVAKSNLRELRHQLHLVFDPLWRFAVEEGIQRKPYRADELIYPKWKGKCRNGAYKWLGEHLKLDSKYSHISMFDEQQCIEGIRLCESYKTQPEEFTHMMRQRALKK